MRAGQRFHNYRLLFTAIAAGANAPASFVVETDYDFYWIKAQFFAVTSAGVALKDPQLTVLLQDGSTSQHLSNATVPVPAQFGSGEIPFILPAPHLVKGGATFNATVYNVSAATIYTVYLVFSGLHVPVGTVLASAQRSARMRR